MTATKGRGCDTKRAHTARADADAHFWQLVSKGAYPGRLNVYRCKHCPHWHVGHKTRRRR